MRKLLSILLLLCSVTLAFAVTALHLSPEHLDPKDDIELLLEITQAAENVAAVNIHYRLLGESIWLSKAMQQDQPGSVFWRGEIPRSVVANNEFEYRFEMQLSSGNTEYLPLDDGKTYFTINPNSPSGTQSDGFVLLSDESSISADDGYMLAVSFLALADDIDPHSIKVYVGGRDVTKQAQITGDVLVYRDEKPRAGIQKAMIVANVEGKELYSDTWITQILPGTGRSGIPFKLRGNVNFSAHIYAESSDDPTYSVAKDDYRTWADLYGNYGILDLQTNLLISSLEDSHAQPVNRFTFGLQLPVLDVFVGDYSPNLSNYTLSGKNIRGIYASLHSEYLALSFAHGESMRKTKSEGNLAQGIPKSGTFKQEALGARLSMGRDNGFRIGFSGSRHRDIVSSLDEQYYRYQTSSGDTLYSVMAQDNAVIGVDARLNVPEQHVLMGFEMAGSITNKNTIPGPMTSEEWEDYLDLDLLGLEIDPEDYADLFVINKNMQPFLPSMANVAWMAYLRMYVWNNFLNVQYNETGSAFYSLGSYVQPQDTKTLSITDQISIGRLLSLTAGYSTTEDNVTGHKSETNSYQNIFAQAILRIPHYPYLKAAFYDNIGENKANTAIEDSIFVPYNRDSQNFSFGIGYNISQIPYVPTQIDLSYHLGNDFSEHDFTLGQGWETLTDNENSGVSLSMNNRFTMIPLRTQFAYTTAKNKNLILDKSYQNSSFYFKADVSLWQNRIKPYLSYRKTTLKGAYDPQDYANINLGVESFPIKNMTATADLGFKSYANDLDGAKDYDTTTFRICLTQRF